VGGALLATGSLVALIYALVEADSAGWDSTQTLGLFVLAAAGIGAFVAVEGRVREPLVTLSAVRRRPTTTALLLLTLGMDSGFSGFSFSWLYLQQVLGHSALRTGLELLPVAVAILVAAHAGGQLIAQLGAKPVIATGLALVAAGALLLSGLSADGSYATDVLPGLLVLSVGGGLAAAGVMITAMSGAGQQDAGLLSGLTTTVHELSVALVLPVLSTIAARRLGAGALERSVAADAGLLTAGFAAAFRAAAAIALVGTFLAVVALRRTDVAPARGPRWRRTSRILRTREAVGG
jgi:predicted MFS family arabinose efflux permease